jgi:hypothetical protein
VIKRHIDLPAAQSALITLRESAAKVLGEFVMIAPPDIARGCHDLFQTFPEFTALLCRDSAGLG